MSLRLGKLQLGIRHIISISLGLSGFLLLNCVRVCRVAAVRRTPGWRTPVWKTGAKRSPEQPGPEGSRLEGNALNSFHLLLLVGHFPKRMQASLRRHRGLCLLFLFLLQKGEKKRKSTKATEGTIARNTRGSKHWARSSDGSECRNRTAEPSGTRARKPSHGWRGAGRDGASRSSPIHREAPPLPWRQRPDAYAFKAGGTLGSELFGVALSHGRSDSLGKMRTAGISSRIKMSRLRGNPSRGTAKMSLNVHLLLPVGQLSTACS